MEKRRNHHIAHAGFFVFALVPLLALLISKSPSQASASVGDYDTEIESYYEGITAEKGDELLGQIHDLITTTHKTYTSYDDNKNGALVYPADPGDDEDHIRDFYTQNGGSLSSIWEGGNDAGTWNREHVWPQSLSNGKWGKAGCGGDMHHIRPEEVRLNGVRGNSPFGEIEDHSNTIVYAKDKAGKDIVSHPGGFLKNDVFEPIDEVKGDVARIVLYVYAHYNSYSDVHGTTNGNGSSSYFGTIPITNVIETRENTASSCFDLLAKWCHEDPVDEKERNRNEVVARYQGNRNPFIDIPDLASRIWEEEEEETSSSSGEEISFSDESLSEDGQSSISEEESFSEENQSEDRQSSISEEESFSEENLSEDGQSSIWEEESYESYEEISDSSLLEDSCPCEVESIPVEGESSLIPSESSSSKPNEEDGSALGGGAIAGIIIGGTLLLAGAITGLIFFLKRKK